MNDYPDLKTLHILRYPDPVLRRSCEEVRDVNSFLDEMVARMSELMQEEKGIGLAAPQVGWNYRLIVANPTMAPGKFEVLINPVIVRRVGRLAAEEGCLSVPGVFAKVRRAEKVTVRGMRLNGETVEYEAEGLPARLWQHEVDHLEGALFVDRISLAGRILIRSNLRDLERRFARQQDAAMEAKKTS